YIPQVENDKSFENWITLIYRFLLENSEQMLENLLDNNTSVSSSDKVNIPLAESRQQWQYAHQSMHSRS
ncbi:11017_t:CDS:1, partial [Cetraspora pellucida]